MESKNLPLTIVIVNWNLKHETCACIDSLNNAGIKLHQIIVVDNGSNDGSIESITHRYGKSIHIISNPENYGFASASNQGIKFSKELGAKWIMLLNNDTIVKDDFLEVILPFLEGNYQYSILAPAIYFHDEPNLIWYLGDRLIPGTLITVNPYQGKPLPKDLPKLLPVDFANGCAMIVRSNVFEEIGYFNPLLYMYGEEVEFCWRARQAHIKIAAIPGATVWHKISMSADSVKKRSQYLKIRNQIYFYNHYSFGFTKLIMLFYSMINLILRIIRIIPENRIDIYYALMLGWFDGWRGNLSNVEL
jgi:GT2 family glycosyltransferase